MAERGQRDLHSLKIMLVIVWTLFCFIIFYLISEILQMLMDNLLTICVDHVFCEQNYMDSLFHMCDIKNYTNSCINHVYLVVLLHFLYDPNDA